MEAHATASDAEISATGHSKIGVRHSTKRKLEAIKHAKDWSYATTVDKAADALMEKEGITVPASSPVPESNAA